MADEEKVEEKKEEVKEEVKEEKVEEEKEVPTPSKDESESRPESVGKEKKEEKKPEPSGKFKNIIKDIESLSVLELAELVKELEERFGVSAAAPVAAAAAGAPVVAAEEEKSAYTVHLVDAGAQKIAVIKAVRVLRQDLGLKEAKDLVDGAPKDVKADMPKAEAEEAKKNLEAAGAKVELK